MTDHGVVVLLQARMASRRLPGKTLRTLAGRPLLTHCIERLRTAGVGPIVVATTTGVEDDVIARLATEAGAAVFRGASDDVLARMADAARVCTPTIVIRATADNPAVDVDAPRRMAAMLVGASADYLVESRLPYGAAVEAVRAEALERAHRLATRAHDREHVTTFVQSRTDLFRIVVADAPSGVRRPDLRLTVDTADDLAYMQRVLDRAGARTGVVPLGRIIDAADRLGRTADAA